ncbi:MAG: hypothetical protein JOZ51_14840 [Chloroflexi bacterium]|nr:hypothetical protein [Chloroflexota bacterium]
MSDNDPNKATSEGSDRADYGGMDANLDKVDLEHADEVGADPPGGLGTDIAGGHRELGQDDETPEVE